MALSCELLFRDRGQYFEASASTDVYNTDGTPIKPVSSKAAAHIHQYERVDPVAVEIPYRRGSADPSYVNFSKKRSKVPYKKGTRGFWTYLVATTLSWLNWAALSNVQPLHVSTAPTTIMNPGDTMSNEDIGKTSRCLGSEPLMQA